MACRLVMGTNPNPHLQLQCGAVASIASVPSLRVVNPSGNQGTIQGLVNAHRARLFAQPRDLFYLTTYAPESETPPVFMKSAY